MATIRGLESIGYNQLLDALEYARPSFDSSCDLDDVLNVLNDLERPYSEGVQTNLEAWEIVGGECNVLCDGFEDLDFSNCQTSLECLVMEANLYYNHHINNGFTEAISDLAEQMHHAIETAYDLGFEGDLRITNGSVFGWSAHNRETVEGCAIYDDKQGHFYPRKLEGELYAIEHNIGGTLYMSASWNPELNEGDE